MKTQWKTLGEIAEINPPLRKGLDPEATVAFVPMAGVSEDGRLVATSYRPAKEVLKGYTAFEEGDVLLAKITPCMENGKATMASPLDQKFGFGSTEFHVLRAENDNDPRFLFHAVWNSRFRKEAAKNMTGSAGQKRVPKSFLEGYQIACPSAAEQKRLAAILDQADAIRRKRQQALLLTDDFLRSVFLDFFGDPATNSRGWPLVLLGDLAEIVTGYAFRSNEYVEDDDSIRLCRGANVLPERIDWSDLARWPKAKSDDVTQFALKPGDVVIAMDRPWISEGFKIAVIKPEDCPALLVQRVARIRGRSEIPNEYLYHLLKHPAFTRHCRPTETTVPHISPKDIRSFIFPLPPQSLQHKFARHVSTAGKIRLAQSSALFQANDLFQSLQNRVFTGQL